MKKDRTKKSPVAAICGALGAILLILLVAVCLPLTIPRVFGYHIYTVVSGSMEPAIPIGSLLYIQEVLPEDMKPDDVIAYYGGKDSTAIITHRVVENRVFMGEFVTKGDANSAEDKAPIPYADFIGKVRLSVPKVGKAAQAFASLPGKITAACLIGLAILLQIVSSLLAKQTH